MGAVTGFINQSEFPAYYHAADILVLASESETWGLVINEGMAAGLLPVASDRVGAVPDLVEGVGEVYPCGDVRGLASALERALEQVRDPGTRDLMKGHVARYRLELTAAGFEEAALSVAGRGGLGLIRAPNQDTMVPGPAARPSASQQTGDGQAWHNPAARKHPGTTRPQPCPSWRDVMGHRATHPALRLGPGTDSFAGARPVIPATKASCRTPMPALSRGSLAHLGLQQDQPKALPRWNAPRPGSRGQHEEIGCRQLTREFPVLKVSQQAAAGMTPDSSISGDGRPDPHTVTRTPGRSSACTAARSCGSPLSRQSSSRKAVSTSTALPVPSRRPEAATSSPNHSGDSPGVQDSRRTATGQCACGVAAGGDQAHRRSAHGQRSTYPRSRDRPPHTSLPWQMTESYLRCTSGRAASPRAAAQDAPRMRRLG